MRSIVGLLLGLVSFAGCHEENNLRPSTPPLPAQTTLPAPLLAPETVVSAEPTVLPRVNPANPTPHAHATGASGTVSLIVCKSGSTSSLGLEVSPRQGPSWSVSLGGLSASTTDESVRFVDVDQDGFPDPVVSNPDRRALVLAMVFLTTGIGGPSSTCDNTISFDAGSQGFLLGVRSLDQAVEILSAGPPRGLSPKEACAALARTTRRSEVNVFGFGDSDGMLGAPVDDPDSIIRCDKKVPDGRGTLHPDMRCDSFRPYCVFGLLSGDTSVPPFERKYWFDTSHQKLTVVGVPQL